MDLRTKYILDKIAKLKADNDADTLDLVKYYWDGFRDGVNTISVVLEKLKNDMIVPVEEALKDV